MEMEESANNESRDISGQFYKDYGDSSYQGDKTTQKEISDVTNDQNEQNDEKNKNDENNISDKNKKNDILEYQLVHFVCKNCHTVPRIEIQSYENVNYYCKCHEIKNQPINYVLNLNVVDETNFSPKEFLACPDHGEDYIYFCKDCKENVCRQCIRKTVEHKSHILEIFDAHFCELDGIVKNILKIFKNNNDINMENLKRLMNAIINDYLYFPNYSHFFIIRQCYFFLNDPKSNTNKIAAIKYDYIKNLKDLIDFKGDLKNIKKIIFPRLNIKDLNDIKFGELINLTDLDLSHNDITCIEPLSKYKLPNLKVLNLTVNLIDDSNKEYFYKFDFPELTDLNLFENKLTDYEIFKLNNNKNMPKLNLVFIGGNNFQFPKKSINKKELTFDFSSVTEMGFSKSVFDQNSIMFLPCFDFQRLEIIYLQGNNLNSLNFVKDLELPSIKEIWLGNNQLTEFEPLKKFKTLEVIEMKNNKVSDIEELDTFIKYLPKIKRINLIGNCIKFDFLIRNILELEVEKHIVVLINPQ